MLKGNTRIASGRSATILLLLVWFAICFVSFTFLMHVQQLSGDCADGKTDADKRSASLTDPDWPMPADTQRSLRPGDSGEAVANMQNRLTALGYLDDGEKAGFYGTVTTASLLLFQRENGLVTDGMAGEPTLALLYSDQANVYVMNQGDVGTDVVRLQRRLQELKYFTGYADGNFDISTTEAVKAFQHENDLTVDGKVGIITYNRMYSGQARPAASSGAADQGAYAQSMRNVNIFLEIAEQQLGKKYILGNEGPDSFDCSGLVYYCLNHAGVKVGRTTALGYSQVDRWKDVEKSDLQPGDLLFFGVNGNGIVGHTGIYLGNDKMIESSSSCGEVMIARLSESYWVENYLSAKRVF